VPSKATILIVDDSRENLSCLRETLRGVEAEILEATSAEEALALVSGRPLALAIVDIVMPGCGGHELARRLREQSEDKKLVPILFVTSYPEDETREFDGYDVGGVDCISRPCNPRLLLAKVRIFLELDRARREANEHREELARLLEARTAELERATGYLREEIAARDRADAQVQELSRQRQVALTAANSELEAFAYSVSHHLRAPLRAIDGFSKILLEEHVASLDDEGRRLFEVVRTNARNMGELIDDILSFSRLGRCGVAFARVNLRTLCDEVLADLRTRRDERTLRVTVGNLPMVWGDRVMLRGVLRNLLENALKFTRPREFASIQVAALLSTDSVTGRELEDGVEPPPPGFATFLIRDNGVGFDMRYAGKLFGVFQRLHGEDEFEGTGAGLAIVKRVVARHGGRVGAHGVVGQGATFWFTLPLEDETERRN
jgi:hypothetical protein